jgi:SH3 domain protein
MQKLLWSLIALVACCPATSRTWAATMYISDELTVPLRRGPSNTYKIIHAGLPSGMALEILGEDKDAGFTNVRTPNGTEGWVPTQYLAGEPSAKDKLGVATKRVQALEAELKGVRDNYSQSRGANKEAEGRSADLTKQTEKLQAELNEIRRVSATSIATYDENKKLKAESTDLNTKVAQLTERVRSLERNVMLRWLLAGGGLVLLGLVAGIWIKARPKRTTWA